MDSNENVVKAKLNIAVAVMAAASVDFEKFKHSPLGDMVRATGRPLDQMKSYQEFESHILDPYKKELDGTKKEFDDGMEDINKFLKENSRSDDPDKKIELLTKFNNLYKKLDTGLAKIQKEAAEKNDFLVEPLIVKMREDGSNKIKENASEIEYYKAQGSFKNLPKTALESGSGKSENSTAQSNDFIKGAGKLIEKIGDQGKITQADLNAAVKLIEEAITGKSVQQNTADPKLMANLSQSTQQART